jgi:hypothetical protein
MASWGRQDEDALNTHAATEGGIMDDLTGSATERMAQLGAADGAQRDAAWLERQLVSALQGWQDTEDELREIREAREDF